ncbi:AAA domain protein [Vibrio phage PhiImVa-1]|nr:AAA domain protein [Vibrio phage PhiImVa-1]
MELAVNDHLVLLEGRAAVGKSASFMNLENPERVAYLNCENGKKLPFPAKFKQVVVTDPMQVPASIEGLNGHPDYDTIIVDSNSFLMQMYENQYVITAPNTMKAWGEYANFFINMMQQAVAKSDKTIIFTSHVEDKYNDSEMITETKAVVKGSLAKVGIEAYFSCVIMAKKMKIKDLEPYVKDNDLLTITPEDEALGFKYVFQTRLTKDTVNEKIRGPMGMWTMQETFINADMQLVINRLKQYYG